MRLKPVLLSTLAVLLVLGGLYAWTWTDPVRGVERSFGRFAAALEAREWESAKAMLASDYRDGFGLNREQVIDLGSRVFERFETLSISARDPRIEVDGNTGRMFARVVVTGRGDTVAMTIVQGSRVMETQTEFVWRRTGRPWQWELVGMRNPDVLPYVNQVELLLSRPLLPGL